MVLIAATPGSLFAMGWLRLLLKGFIRFFESAKKKYYRDWSRQKMVLGNDPLGAARIGYCPERSNFCVYVLIPTYAEVLNGLRVLAM